MLPERMENGRLPGYAFPGGYPLLYLFADGGVCCPDCANGDNRSDAFTSDRLPPGRTPEECAEDRQWHVIGCDVHHEGPPMVCDHCGKAVESAYGDPDAPEVPGEWSGSADPSDPDNFWIDESTGERVNATTGERTAGEGGAK